MSSHFRADKTFNTLETRSLPFDATRPELDRELPDVRSLYSELFPSAPLTLPDHQVLWPHTESTDDLAVQPSRTQDASGQPGGLFLARVEDPKANQNNGNEQQPAGEIRENAGAADRIEEKENLEKAAKTEPLKDEEIPRVQYLQNDLQALLPRLQLRLKPEALKQLMQDLADESKGIVRDKEGNISSELGTPIFGTATKKAYQTYLSYLQEEAVPSFYTMLAIRVGGLPTKGPVTLPITDTGEGRNNARHPVVFLEDATNGRLRCQLGIDGRTVPSWNNLQKLSDTYEWIGRARDQIEKLELKRIKAMVDRRLTAGEGLKSWGRLEKPSQIAAALQVMDLAKRAGRTMEAIDYLKDRIRDSTLIGDWLKQQNLKDWISCLKPENLPPGCVIKHKNDDPNGPIESITFDLPKTLDLLNPTNVRKLANIQKWLAKFEPIVRNAMAVHSEAAKDPKYLIAFGNVEVPFGWVKFGVDPKTKQPTHDYTQSHERPEGEGWNHFNQVQYDFNVINERNKLTGDLVKVKVSSSMEYQDSPVWSYFNFYAPRVKGHPDLTVGQNGKQPREFDPNVWLTVRTHGGQIKFMKACDLDEFRSEQWLAHYGPNALIAFVDASILLSGASNLAAGDRALRVAATAGKTLEVAEAAAKLPSAARAIRKGATLFEELSANTKLVVEAERALANQGYKHIRTGLIEIGVGLTGAISNSAGTYENEIAHRIAQARGIYFMTTMGKDLFWDLPKGLLTSAKAESLADRIWKASSSTSHWTIRGAGKAGEWGFRGVEIPFCTSMSYQLTEESEIYNRMLKFDPINVARKRLDSIGKPVEDKNESSPESDLQKQQQSFESQVAFLERYRKGLSVQGEAAKQVDTILAGAKDLLAPKTDETNEQFQKRKDAFIKEILIPHFLATSQQIASAERSRADRLPYDSREFINKKTFSDSEIEEQSLAGTLAGRTIDKDVRAAAAVALLHLTRDANGGLGKRDKDNKPTGVLFEQQIELPSWSVTKYEPTGADTPPAAITYKIPTRTATQKLRIEDVVDVLRADLDPSHIDRSIETGDVLTRAGMPAETYAAVLKEIITNPNSSDKQRDRAIANLGSVIVGLRADERNRSALGRGKEFDAQGQSNDLSSGSLQAFLVDYTSKASNPKDARALAGFISHIVARKHLAKEDLDRLKIITSGEPKLAIADFTRDMSKAAFQDQPKTVEDWDRKLQAALSLELLATANDSPAKINQSDIDRAIADCVSAQKEFEAKVLKSRQELAGLQEQLEKKPRDQELQKTVADKTAALQKQETERVMAGDIALRARDQLLAMTKQNALLRLRINHMDESDDSKVRESALLARKQIMTMLRYGNVTDDDVRIKVSLIGKLEPLLREDTRIRQRDESDRLRAALRGLRTEAASAMQAVLVPKEDSTAATTYPTLKTAFEEFDELRTSATKYAELREAALAGLTTLAPFSSVTRALIKSHLLTETELDPDVRFAALRAAELTFPKNRLGDMSQQILARKDGDKDHPPELDAAVALRLYQWKNRAGMAISPESVSYIEQRAQTEKDLLKVDKISNAEIVKLIREKYAWLEPGALRNELHKAKNGVYGWFGSYWWDSARGNPKAEEFKAQQKKYEEYISKYNALITQALEGDTEEKKQEGLKLLYYTVTQDPRDWTFMDTEIDGTAYGWTSKNGYHLRPYQLKDLQNKAAKALADACKEKSNRQSDLIPMIQKALRNENTPTDAKIELAHALKAISTTTQEGRVVSTADAPAAVETAMQCLMDTLKLTPLDTKGADNAWNTLEMEYRKQLCEALLQYLKEFAADDPSVYTFLDALGHKSGEWKTDDERRIPTQIRELALEITARNRDSVTKLWLSMPEPSADDSATDRAQLLLEAKLAARRYIEDSETREAAVKELEQLRKQKDLKSDRSALPVDVARDLQERENRNAIHNIFAACKGRLITTADDPRRNHLSELTSSTYPEQVRQAAAHMLATQSEVRADRDCGLKTLARQAVHGTRLGFRLDAQAAIESISSPEDCSCLEAELTSLKTQLFSAMRTQLKLDQSTSETEVLRRMQESDPESPTLPQLAACLTHLAIVKLKQMPPAARQASVEPLFRTAMNLFARSAVDQQLPQDITFQSTAAAISLARQNLYMHYGNRYSGTEHLFFSNFCLQKYIDCLSGQESRERMSLPFLQLLPSITPGARKPILRSSLIEK